MAVKKYKLGAKYSRDFDYDGMLAMGLKTSLTWGVKKLTRLYNSFESVNYHECAKPLWDTIEYLKENNVISAKQKITEFHEKIADKINEDEVLVDNRVDISKDLKNFDIENLDAFERMQYDNFIKQSSKEEVLQIIINSVEGDYDQLSHELSVIAQKQDGIIECEKCTSENVYNTEEGLKKCKDCGHTWMMYEKGGVTSDNTIATTILQQLGGAGKLNAMTGAYAFGNTGNGLSFRIKNQKANYIKITLNSKDLYDAEVGRTRGFTYKVVSEASDLFADQLKPFIEKSTGMYLTLFAKGGNIKYVPEDEKHKTWWGRKGFKEYGKCVGSFDISYKGHLNDFYIYALNDFDKDFYSHVKLKDGEKLFRYETETAKIGGYFPLIKINIKKGLVYFMEDMYSDDDKNPVFETKGIKPKYISLHKSEEMFAKGGNIKINNMAKQAPTKRKRFKAGGEVTVTFEKMVKNQQQELHIIADVDDGDVKSYDDIKVELHINGKFVAEISSLLDKANLFMPLVDGIDWKEKARKD